MMKKTAYAIVSILMMLTMTAQKADAQQLALNTDVLWDAAMMPNLGIEMTTGNRSTLQVDMIAGKNSFGRDVTLVAVQPEFRYFLSGRSMYHHFIGVGAVAASYELSIRSRHYEGYGAGLGVTFGYVIPLASRLNLDLHAGLGAFAYQQMESSTDMPYDKDNGINAHGYYIAPTRIGVSLTYIIK